MDKRTWVVVDLDKLRHNVRALQEALKPLPHPVMEPCSAVTQRSVTNTFNPYYEGIKILAVVKADAYGHGAKEISDTLKESGVHMLGVASVDEAYELKEIDLPIVILFPVPADDIPTIVAEEFIPTISDYEFANTLNYEARHQNKYIKVHIGIDTGLFTAGVNWEEGVNLVDRVLQLQNLKLDGIFTHFAESDNRNSEFTDLQVERFKTVLNGVAQIDIRIPWVHTAATSAILNFPNSYFNMVRPGIMLYGMYTAPECDRRIQVEPILSWHTRICRVSRAPKGTGISYSRAYITNRDQKIATLMIGYGDGYPRSLSNKGVVLVRGKFAKIVGMVCMDLMMVDVTDISGVEVGDEVTLIGKNGSNELTTEDVASLAGSINYEITTRIGPRVSRIYVQNGRPCKTRCLLEARRYDGERKHP